MATSNYDGDIVAGANEQARLLRAGLSKCATLGRTHRLAVPQ